MKKIYLFLLIIVFNGCIQKPNLQISYVSEFVFKDSIYLENMLIGGLSDVDASNGFYYFVVDDAKQPRFLKAKITIEDDTIRAVNFLKGTHLKKESSKFFTANALDLEAVFIDEEKQQLNFSSEGNIKLGKKPTIFTTDLEGTFIAEYQLPEELNNLENIQHNGALEGVSKSIDTKGFWSAMEAPLKKDGAAPTFTKTPSPVRITYYNFVTKKATKQFAYQLEHITKPAKGNVNLSGLTAILEYEVNKFLIIERTYQSGYGAYGNIVRIFKAEINLETTNILGVTALSEQKFIPLKKTLVFDFETVKDKLTDGIIDNIEGVTFGPKLKNGNQSLLLVSDNNFQEYGKQLNQFILLEMITK